MTCTFFGHRDTPYSIREKLKLQIIDLIDNMGVDMFYVGNHGNFDRMAIGILKTLKLIYPIDYRVLVVDFTNHEPDQNETEDLEGIDEMAKILAIEFCSEWMIGQSDFVVAYIAHKWGDAAKCVSLAKQKKLRIFNLFEDPSK